MYTWRHFWQAAFLLAALFVMPMLFPIVFERLDPTFIEMLRPYSESTWTSSPATLVAMMSAAVIALMLYRLRCTHPVVYGAGEILAGISIVAHLVDVLFGKVSNRGASGLVALGAVYIFVRGLDNMYRGMKPASDEVRTWNRIFFGQNTGAKL